MQQYSIGKGRKKEVAKFTMKHGLWIFSTLMLFGLLLVLLMVLGFLHIDAD